MFLIIGYVIILASALGTYAVHGSLGALWVPTEYIAIVGLTLGGFVAGNGPKAIKSTIAALPTIFKGSPYSKAFYIDVLCMLYEILAKVRKEGLMSIEGDIENPEGSPILSKYPAFTADHHAVDFLCDYLRMMVGGNLNAFEIENLMDIEMETHHHEAHMPVHVVSKVADGVPAFGIVVAVMGVVNVMGSVGQPPAVLGKMIGGALVGVWRLSDTVSMWRAARSGEIRQAVVTGRDSSNWMSNGAPLVRIIWSDATGVSGRSRLGHAHHFPAPGTRIIVYADPRTGRTWWEEEL